MLVMCAFPINRFAALFTHEKNWLFCEILYTQNLVILISVHHFLQLAGSRVLDFLLAKTSVCVGYVY